MNVLNNSSDEVVECPLCMEPLEADDLNFFPCTCGYQICRFCWHRIRTDENELCPACRKAYPENPADFTPLSQEQIAALKLEKRQRDQQRKKNITENRKHLANVRVVQKNLVFVVGLPPRLADADTLKKHEYFGKYGKIHKVVINPSTAYAGQQGPSASAYVTYVHNNDALRAIQSVNNIAIDGRLIKTSLGTTKYCSHFMKNQQCPKGDCMYLHELGDPEASFTKDEMHQGKHQEYEKRLHDALIASSNGSVTTNNKSGDNKLGNGTGGVPSKEAWPSLSTSPVNTKEQSASGGKGNGKGKENGNRKHDKSRGDKKGQKGKGRNDSSNNNRNSSSNRNKLENNNSNSSSTTNGVANGVATATTNHNHQHQNGTTKESSSSSQINDTRTRATTPASSTISTDKQPAKQHQQEQQQQQQQNQSTHSSVNRLSADDEVNLIDDLDKDTSSEDNDMKNGDTRSLSSSSSNSGDSGSSLSESASGKSSPGTFQDHPLAATPESQKTTSSSSSSASSTSSMTDTQGTLSSENLSTEQTQLQQISSNPADTNNINSIKSDINILTATTTESSDVTNIIDTSACLSKLSLFEDSNSFFTPTFEQLFKEKLDNDNNRTSINNQLNSAITSHLPDLLNGIDGYSSQNNSSILNGLGGLGGGLGGLGGISATPSGTSLNSAPSNSFIDGPDKYLVPSLNTTEEWEQALKYFMMRNNKQMEDQQQQHQQQQQHHQQQQQDEYMRLQELHKRNLINSIGVPQPYNHEFNMDFPHNGLDMNRLSQSQMYHHQQQQQHQQQRPNSMHQEHSGSMFGTNMSKFFDFHKNQQQQQIQHQHYLMNGYGNNMMNEHRDHLAMATLLDNNRINSQHMDHTNGLVGQQFQKQRLFNKFDQIGSVSSGNMFMNPNNNSQQQHQLQSNRIHSQYVQNAPVDDDLGFDPFFETQKALAELMENEQSQNNHNKHILENCQRARMPPPGFNHMNAFGFGVPRPQSSSKILPFMNNAQQMPPQQNNWSHHMSGFPQPQQLQQQQQQPPQNQGNDPQMHMGQPNQNHNKGGYGNMSDWTAMDPAILSFRQFPSYSTHPQHDLFMQHMNQQQQQQQQPGQGFGHHGQQMQNNLMNQQQQNTPPQMNYPHTNWFNNASEQPNMFMNSLGNGGGYSTATNNYEKFTIPPGIHMNNMNNCISTGNKQQKTECIN